jgi:hypothetical protein
MIDEERLKKLEPFLIKEGYHALKVIEGRGICGIFRFMFTTAIVYGIDGGGYKGRYCYPHGNIMECVINYFTWDGVDDPRGPWVKHKGHEEYTNPELKEDIQ